MPFMLRRTKADTDLNLPPKKEIHLYVGLTNMQIEMYKNQIFKKNPLGIQSENVRYYMNMIMQLRKVCNHPYLFDDIEDVNQPVYGDHLITVCGKMRVLDKLLNKVYNSSI